MKYSIPFGKPLIEKEEKDAVSRVLKNPILVHGSKTPEFENLFSNFTKSKNSIAVSSCTAGMHLIYFSLGVGAGDEVIVSSQTHVATAHAVELTGAKAVFVDSNDTDGNIDIDKIIKKISKKTKAICVVHYLGIPSHMEKISKIARKNKLFLIEDCALALGSTINKKHVGLFGDAGVFSFYPVKHITSAEGGMIITNNNRLTKKLRLNRAFGVNRSHSKRKFPGLYNVPNLGFNYRMSELHAAIGCEQIKKIKRFLKIRKTNFLYLKKLLNKNKYLKIIDSTSRNFNNSYYCLTILLPREFRNFRSNIINHLQLKGVGYSIYYPHPVPRLEYYQKKYRYVSSEYTNASYFSDYSIALPVGPHLQKKDMNNIAITLINIINSLYEK